VSEATPVPGGDRQRSFMEFETITLAPIDIDLVEPSLLTESEREWLNLYHRRVYETLSPLLDDETRHWLADVTRTV
jgi:Xaa-Pro aminopeptidase